jgi:hypothetical protein
MKKNNCELIRRELDELMLDEACSAAAAEHLRECAACREFQEQQTKLRQIVGGLGTVSAPADFDFRLRARLANESNASVYWTFLKRGFAFAALLLFFAMAALLVRNVMNRPAAVEQIATKEQPREAAPQPTSQPRGVPAPADDGVVAGIPKKPASVIKERPSPVAFKNRRSLATLDSAFERADVINGAEPVGTSAAFPIDAASLQSFIVSLDDGRGNAKTISVPTISFGSQRIVQGGNQFASKRVW